MKVLKFTMFFLAFLTVLPVSIKAQEVNFCGTDEARRKLIEEHPEILEQEKDLEAYTRDFVANYIAASGSRSSHYVIPLVFHIISQAGPENITDAQIMSEMDVMNKDWNKLNTDLWKVIPPFRPIIGNMGIEFRMANRDPNGNVCNGIDRIYSVQTYVGNDYSKLNNWPRDKYMNVWIVTKMGGGAAGYAYYPGSVNSLYNTPARDGVILLQNYIGSMGTSSVFNSRTLTHEIGHCFNLKHVWGDSNNPGVACGDDDVNDTPITEGWNSCPGITLTYRDSITHSTRTIQASSIDSLYAANPMFVTDSIYRKAIICTPHIVENYQNFMEYSYCSFMFSNGQVARAIAALNSTSSDRNNLWSPDNLIATGTEDTIYDKAAPIADFGIAKRFVCTNDDASFLTITDASEVDSYLWTFSNAIPSTSTLRNPVVKFQTSGYQTVTLTVTNAQGSTTKTRNNLIFVSYANTQYIAPYTQGFEDPNVFNSGWGSANYDDNNTSFTRVNYGTHSGNGVAMLNNYVARNDHDIDEIVSPGIDLTSLSPAQMYLTFQYSWASASQSFNTPLADSMNVYASIDCGHTWSSVPLFKKGAFYPSALLNAGSVNGPYQPGFGQSYWKFVSVSIPSTLKKPHVMFRFQAFSAVGGNNLYIDDINIGLQLTAIEDLSVVSDLTIFPNPTHGEANLKLELTKAGNLSVKVYDLTGKEVLGVYEGWVNDGETQMAIEGTSKLSAGIYVVNVKAGESVIQKKLVIQ